MRVSATKTCEIWSGERIHWLFVDLNLFLLFIWLSYIVCTIMRIFKNIKFHEFDKERFMPDMSLDITHNIIWKHYNLILNELLKVRVWIATQLVRPKNSWKSGWFFLGGHFSFLNVKWYYNGKYSQKYFVKLIIITSFFGLYILIFLP